MNLQQAIQKVIEGNSLSQQEMVTSMQLILEEKASAAQISAFLVSLRCKGESVEEILGAVRVMRQHMTPFRSHLNGVLDTCGTGGDGSGTINVSTLVALVAAGAGVPVAKHGNRSVSSQCGSADLFESLGVKIDTSVSVAERMLKEIGITFLFAPLYHPAVKNVAAVRKELGIRTLFNLLGPLCNPAGATHQLMGVFSVHWLRPMAQVLGMLGSKHLLVVYGADGMDEISTSAPTHVCEWNRGELSEYDIAPEKFGIARANPLELKGGNAEQNREIALKILQGIKGSYRDLVLLNAGAALYAADQTQTILEGIEMAKQSLDGGKALEKLRLLQQYSQGVV